MDTRVFDTDSHVFEPAAIWDEYLEPQYRVAARSAFWYRLDEAGTVSVILNGRTTSPMGRSKIIREAIWHPGMGPKDIGQMDPAEFRPINPGANNASARLRDMDAMGIEASLLFPTLFAEYFPIIENPDVQSALARAYNDWILDFCKAAPGRLIPVAVLPLQLPVFAVEETERAKKRGFKAVFLRPAYLPTLPVEHHLIQDFGILANRSLSHPSYDVLWSELESAGLAAFVHPSPGSTNPESASTGGFIERVSANLRIGHSITESLAPVLDNAVTLCSFCFTGHLERYPKLKLAFAHGGISWVDLALEKAETRLILHGYEGTSLKPEEVFYKHPALVTFDSWESNIGYLHDIYGKLGAWGSRYPQHDASMPQEAMELLQRRGVPGNVVSDLMGGNARRFLGLKE